MSRRNGPYVCAESGTAQAASLAAPKEPCFPPVPMMQAEQEDRKRKLEQEANAASSTLAGGSVPGAEGVVEVGKDGAFDVDQTPMVSKPVG